MLYLVSLKISLRGHVSLGIHGFRLLPLGSATDCSSMLGARREELTFRLSFQWGSLDSEFSQR